MIDVNGKITQEEADRLLICKLRERITDKPSLLEEAIKAIVYGVNSALEKTKQEYVRMETLAACFLALVPEKRKGDKPSEWVENTICKHMQNTTHYFNEDFYIKTLEEYIEKRKGN